VVDFDRDFYGADAQLAVRAPARRRHLSTTVGIEAGRRATRARASRTSSARFGVKGALRRDETDDVTASTPMCRPNGKAALGAHRRPAPQPPEGSTSTTASSATATTAAASTTATPRRCSACCTRWTPRLNLYASAARGFETPTLNELFYSGGGAGFNFKLAPATSTHWKSAPRPAGNRDTRVNAALFQVRTRRRTGGRQLRGGRTSYRNASATLRQGAEVSLDADLAPAGARLALSMLRATYDEAFGRRAEGSRLPGVPRASLYGELAWKDASGRFGAALETVANGKVYAEDANTERPAPGYAVVNARVQASQQSIAGASSSSCA
jgi:iron complex outermembrane receptor protein